jgi:signal transduction histidine kinase
VTLQIERLAQSLRIEVKDTGIGIPEDQKDRVFEEFQQVAGDARRAYEGTGLGLAMVRDIVRLMGGQVELHTQLGVGSHFIIELHEQSEIHLRQAPDTIAPRTSQAIATGATTLLPSKKDAQGPHILVVDDHELNCELLRDILGEEGYRVSVAFGGHEALQFLRQNHPDLVLLDMMMPYVSGEDVMKAMQADALMQDVPVILITARASDDDRLFGLSLGADDYLAKPIHHEELLFRVRNILHRAETIHRVAVFEERERLAQLGQLMRDLSHELKNVFQLDHQDPGEVQQTSELILKRLPLDAPIWSAALPLIAADEKINATDVRLEPYGFRDKAAQTDRSLRYLRSVIAQLPLDIGKALELWEHIQSQSPETWKECEGAIHFIRNHSVLTDQTRYASELNISILDYSRTREDQAHADLSLVIPKVIKLIQPNLKKYRIPIELTLKPYVARIDPAQLMQIVLNLLINASDAASDLTAQERWIRLSVHESKEHIMVRVENGGKPIPADIVERLFHEGESTKGNKGYGLGLVISQRILMRGSGKLSYDSESAHPCFVIRLPWLREDAHAAQTA